MFKKTKKIKLALLCGGPSPERGISLNSARSVCDHLDSEIFDITPIYFDYKKNPYKVSKAQLYSNTPSDFDFKLKSDAKELSLNEFKSILKETDIAFPAMHGKFGEDGQIQEILEKNNCPYIGSEKEVCQNLFDKYNANEHLKNDGFFVLPTLLLEKENGDNKKIITKFFEENKTERAIVKPARSGSSIGVYSVISVKEALSACEMIFKEVDERAVIQPFAKGVEFTVIVLQNRFKQPVALMPTEIEINYSNNQIFDYRKKYLPSNHVTYHCPPKFDEEITEKIQIQAEQLFLSFGVRDFARFDGWLLDNGEIWFADFNPISGMEQNSFLFLQSSQIGMSHKDVLHFILKNACNRHNISWEEKATKNHENKKNINILFGGNTAERQVSVMSGTNAWLKLKKSNKYSPSPFLLDNDLNVWELPYFLTLNHTVEEILDSCQRVIINNSRIEKLRERVLQKLSALPEQITEHPFLPKKMRLKDFIQKSDFVFLGLHGGVGENGVIQKMLQEDEKPFNGSNSVSAKICMDKFETGQMLSFLQKEGIFTAKKKLEETKKFRRFQEKGFQNYWTQLLKELKSETIIVKPYNDGCSAGIVRLFDAEDLEIYFDLVFNKAFFIPENTFRNQSSIIDMPTTVPEKILFEEFIETDDIKVIEDKIQWKNKTGWIEITVGVLGKTKNIKALNPSITISSGEVLSVEEKFQGGTGVNITPPPLEFVSKEVIEKAKKSIELVAKKLMIYGYARIDAFLNIKNGDIIVIEANALPGITPSTVIFHQALTETPPIYPTEFFEKIVDLGYKRK